MVLNQKVITSNASSQPDSTSQKGQENLEMIMQKMEIIQREINDTRYLMKKKESQGGKVRVYKFTMNEQQPTPVVEQRPAAVVEQLPTPVVAQISTNTTNISSQSPLKSSKVMQFK